MSAVSSVGVEDREPQSTDKTFEPFRSKIAVPSGIQADVAGSILSAIVESVGGAIVPNGCWNQSATALVNREIACSQREKEIARQISRVSPYINWVIEGGDRTPEDEKFQRSVRAVIELLSASLFLPTPVPTSSVDIEKGASLFLNDDISYFDIEVFDNIIEFYAKDKVSNAEFFGEEEVVDGRVPPSLLATLFKLYARNK